MRAAPLLSSASIVAVLSGSALALGELPLAARRFGFDVQMIALHADLSRPASLVRTPQMLTLTADTLDSFTKVMWTVSGA